MWLHIVIFVILFLLAAGSRLGWLHVEQIGTQKGRKLFLAVALTGNIMGLAMTCTKGGGEIYQDGYELKKENVISDAAISPSRVPLVKSGSDPAGSRSLCWIS